MCTGPLFLPRKEADGKSYIRYQVIGANSVAVPTHFYKVVVCESADGRLEMESYVMPNKIIENTTPLTVFQVNEIVAVIIISGWYTQNWIISNIP